MAAAESATNVPANIRENSLLLNASSIKCKDQATKATSNMRIGINIVKKCKL